MGGRVLGVDGCKAGWVGVAVGDPPADSQAHVYAAPRIDALVAAAERDGPVTAVAVDMPIGLPDGGRRQADLLARKQLGPAAASVFVVPVRQALLTADYAAAVTVNRELTGAGFSRQAFALAAKILEVERWVRSGEAGRRPVIEAHPEVTFRRLAADRRLARKTSWAGAWQRWRLLSDAGIRLTGELEAAGTAAGVDDVLDAGAMAWTAGRFARGEATCVPDPPETFSDGVSCAIWT